MKTKEEKKKVKKEKKEKVVKEEKDKTQFSLVEVIVIMIICIIFGLLIGGYIVSQRRANLNEEHRIDFNEINGLYEDINRNYYGEYTSDSFRDNTVKGMLSYLDDPYARLISSEESKDYMESLESEFIGIGMEITKEETDEYARITKIYSNTPADRGGLKENDLIIKVDKKDLTGLGIEEIIKNIKGGSRGDKVKLTLKRDEKTIEKELSKEIITLPTVDHKIIEKSDKKIGEIIISNFSKNTYSEFKVAYETLKKEKVDGLIIDLRDNGGGYLTSAAKVTSMFLDNNKVIYIEKKKDKEEKILSHDEKIIKDKVVILINGGTASGSEIMASSLKMNADATLVGTVTYGKNTIQKIHSLKDEAIVKFTVGEWLTSEGQTIKEDKVKPDVVVEDNTCCERNTENDEVLNQALKIFE